MGQHLGIRELSRIVPGKPDPTGFGRKLKKLKVPIASGTPKRPKYDVDVVMAALAPNITAAPMASTSESTSNLHPSPDVATSEDAHLAVSLIKQVLREEGSVTSVVDLDAARTAETILKARERHLAIEVETGRLVDGESVRKLAFEWERETRDYWSNWPAMVSPELAAELGTDQIKLAIALERLVRKHLAERAAKAFRLAA